MANEVYNWADEPGTSGASYRPPAVSSEEVNMWDPTGSQRRADLARRLAATPLDQTNLVTGHALDCACPKCPMGAQIARMHVGAVAPERAPRPLQDMVIPVAVLMVVFTLCSVVLLPVVMPFVAMGTMSLGFIAVCLGVVSVAGFGLARTVRGAAREASGGGEVRYVRGRVLPPRDE